MLVLATEAMRAGNLVEAQRLVSAARAEYEEKSDQLALADMIQSRIDRAAPAEGVSASRAAEPLSSAELQAAARKAARQAVAAKLAAKLGPVAWSPTPETPEQQAAMSEGDAAIVRTVAAISAKEFVRAYEVRAPGVRGSGWGVGKKGCRPALSRSGALRVRIPTAGSSLTHVFLPAAQARKPPLDLLAASPPLAAQLVLPMPRCYAQALEGARAAFSRAGDEVLQARSMALDNLYGYIQAEKERNGRLQRLIRLKQLLAKKNALEDEGADRIAKAIAASGAGEAGGAVAGAEGRTGEDGGGIGSGARA
jgi:hypothetical protein